MAFPISPSAQRKTAAEKIAEADKIQVDADEANRPITEEEETKVFGLLDEAKALNKDAARREALETARAAQEHVQPRLVPLVESKDSPDKALLPKTQLEAEDSIIKARHGFKNFGEFSMSVYRAHNPNIGIRDPRLDFFAGPTGASQKVGADGGYLVPPAFLTSVWDDLNQNPDNLVALTTSYPVAAGSDSLTIPANAETSRATGSRFGGVQAYWLSEASQITSSKATIRQIRGEPQQLGALCYVTEKLLDNAPALEAYLQRALTQELAFFMSDAIVNGDGAGKPLGILNAPCTVSVAKETGQVTQTVVLENVVKMFARLHPSCRINARWFINVEVEPQLQQMSLGIGTSGYPMYMPPGGLSAQPFGTLFGRPVQPIEYSAALGTVGDIILADMSKYLTFTRGGVQAASSIHLRFDFAEVAFRWMTYLDGKPALASAITPYKGNNTLSCFVTLATR